MNDLITTLKAMQIHPSDSKARLNIFTEHCVYKALNEGLHLKEMDNGSVLLAIDTVASLLL